MAKSRGRFAYQTPPQSYGGAKSGYGATRADSVGVNPGNPRDLMGTQAAKQYKTSKGTADWDGASGISPPLRAATASVGD